MARFTGLAGVLPRYLRLLRSQYWPADKLNAYIDTQLSQTLRSAVRIPFYADRFERAPRSDQLASLPILPRGEVPRLAESVRSMRPDWTRIVSSRTSGSTGMPVPFFFDASHQAGRFAARARYLRANRWSPLERSAWITNIAMESPDAEFTRRSRFLGARFFPHTADLEQQANWLCQLDPKYLYAYPVNLEGLAQVFEASGRRLKSLRKIFSGSEVLEDSLRTRLTSVFGVGVSDNYGSTEAFLAWQCPRGGYHINSEHVLLQIVDEQGRAAAARALGRVLVTTLENRVMPLIRYEIGDYAMANDKACPCGRTLPLIGRIVGRGVNLFVDADRKRFVPWDLFRPLKDREWVRQYQVVQRSVSHYLVRFVSDRPFLAHDEADVLNHFQRILHRPLVIKFERVEKIARAPSGKFMTALCEIPQSAGDAQTSGGLDRGVDA